MKEHNSKIFAQYNYRRSLDQDRSLPARHPVVVVGAGPVGLTLAIDLAQRDVPVVVLDDSDRIGGGSRAICFAKRTLEIMDRLGVGETALAKGVQWSTGKVFHRDRLLYQFDLLPEHGHKMPAFVNLQQYYVEKYLIDRIHTLANVDLRWRNRASAVAMHKNGVRLSVETPDGSYNLDADWVIACDGSRSSVRGLLDLDFAGEQFEDQFLIADVKMTAKFPTERWFWFEPPFHTGQSALLHKQPDHIWRIDLQLSPDANPEHEKRPEIVSPRLTKMLGHDNFELEWISLYRFQCRRIDHFVHGRVIFAGDSAHQVSPFGARGANSGMQDSENLAWKLAAVINGSSPPSLIATYDNERGEAADDNIGHSTRSTDFIAPHSPAEKHLRDAVLALANITEFGKRMVNSGRLSVPTPYTTSPLSTPDRDTWDRGPAPGAPILDVPLIDGAGRPCFLTEILGRDFTLVVASNGNMPNVPAGMSLVLIGEGGAYLDSQGLFAQRYDATPGCAYLLRPDTYVAARWRLFDLASLKDALNRARGL
jgi:3-(3-hydroxy-phenyl)propionate hydroxylase